MAIALFLNDYGSDTPTTSVLRRALSAGADGADLVWIRQRRSWRERFRGAADGSPLYTVGLPRGWPFSRWAAAGQSAWIFRRHGVRLAHLHWSGVDHWGFSILRALWRRPFVLTFHAFNAQRLERMELLDRGRLRRLLLGADRVTAVSAALRSAVAAVCPEAMGRIEIVPNGVAAPQAAGAPPPGLPRDFVLSVGTFCGYKGSDLLLLAFFDLWRRGLDLPLVICGQDEPKGQLRRLVAALRLERHVVLLPDCPHDTVLALMERCRFYVCASREESFGLAVLEAMARGRAVAAPKVGGIPEYVVDGINGLLFEPGDAAGLARAAERLWRDEGLRSRLGAEARRTAEGYSWSRARQGYDRIQKEALGAAR